jgi:NAD(P)-dependent dehydrogenase (short-subunit alcohol dehydrogenase family)
MAKSNVKNIIVLSRSGLGSEGAQELAAELEAQGVRLAAPICDIGDTEQVQAAIKECEKSMPPIRGVIQSALKLKVRILRLFFGLVLEL